MIIDLNLKGKQALIVGGGGEADRKVEALLTQDCEIIVLADCVSDAIKRRADEGKIVLKTCRVDDGEFLQDYERLILVMAVTDDKELNRSIVKAAKALRCYVYSVDDPEASDFSHPAVINIDDTVQIAVSTGGKSPLMAGTLRRRFEPVLRELVQREDILLIRLQERMRQEAQNLFPTPNDRKRFLKALADDVEIKNLLAGDKFEEALRLALARIKDFSPAG